MPPIQSSRFENFLRRLFDITGSPVADYLNPEIVPVASATHPYDTLISSFDSGWLRFQGFTTGGGVAGEFRSCQGILDAGDRLAIVHWLYVHLGAANTNVRVGFAPLQAGALTANTERGHRDQRAPAAQPSMQLYHGSNAARAVTSNYMRFQFGAGDEPATLIIPGPWIMYPQSQAISAEADAVNVSVAMSMIWSERVIEPADTLPRI